MSTAKQTSPRAIPLVELHLHIEGAIPLPAMWKLIERYGGDPSVPDLDALSRRFQYRDFPHFVETWLWKNQFLRWYDDFAFIAEQVARDLVRQDIRYVEMFYSPTSFALRGLKTQELTQAIRTGLDRVPEVEVALIADLIRDLGPEVAAQTLRDVAEAKQFGVIGVGLGGSEHAFPAAPFAKVFDEARRLGFHTTAHAGETAGPESIWETLRCLKVERIGHGTRAGEDPSLVDYLAERQIPLEMCPLSNVRTGVVARIEDHAVRRYFDRGLLVCINTDDPMMFGNSLTEEYRVLEQVFGFSLEEIRRIKTNAVQASWRRG